MAAKKKSGKIPPDKQNQPSRAKSPHKPFVKPGSTYEPHPMQHSGLPWFLDTGTPRGVRLPPKGKPTRRVGGSSGSSTAY